MDIATTIQKMSTKESHSKCNNCGGNLTMQVKVGDKSFTVPVMCKCQNEEYERKKEDEYKREQQLKLDKLRRYSLMDNKFTNCKFESFEIDEENKKLYKIAFNYCRDWHEIKKEGIGLLLWGTPGTGKTYTTFCIANRLLDNLTPVIAISSIALINRIYESYRKFGDEGESQIINSLQNADLLILDDLGAEHESKMGKEKQILYSVIDSRYRNGKPMIVTTNLSLSQLKEKLTGTDGVARTYDRLIEMCTPIEIKGKSRRQDAAKDKGKIIERLLRE